MLEQIRRNVRHPYIQVLLGLIILVFILFFGWGMESQKPTYVAKVNGDIIDYRSYQEAYNGLVSLYQEAFRGDLTGDRIRELGLGRRAVDQLIDGTLLAQEAGRRRIKVSEAELQAAIAGVAVFQEEGAFRKELYLRVLDANRLSPLEYETAKRRELLLQKVEAAIRSEAVVSEADVEREFRDRNTRIALEHVGVDPALLEATIQPTADQMEEFYGVEAESFRTPEKRVARYLLFRPEDYEASVPVTRQEAEDEYHWRAAEFEVAEAVRARHILLQVEQGAAPEDEARVRDRAEALRREVLAGASFAQMAQLHSEDAGTKEHGGDLGFFERGRMVPAFEEAAFSLEPGSVSEPVRSPFGYHLIWVEEKRPARQAPFEEVEEALTAEIRRRKALEEAYAAADNLLMDLEDRKTTWDALEASHPVRRTTALARDALPTGVERPADLVAALFALGPDRPGVLLETSAGTYLLAVASVEPSAVPSLDAVREQVSVRFRKAEARRMAQARVREFLAAAADKGWDAAVQSFGLAPQRTEAFARKGGAVPGLGWAPALKEAAFAVTQEGGLVPEPHEVNGKFYAFRVTARTEPDLAQLAADRERLRAEILPGKQEEYLKTYLDTLRNRAKIEINDALLF